MNDNDIIKALECCIHEPMLNCRLCPYENSCNMGRSDIQRDVFAFINRLKAEIERLTAYNENLQTANTALSNEILDIRTKVIKEIMERLRNNFFNYYDGLTENTSKSNHNGDSLRIFQFHGCSHCP